MIISHKHKFIFFAIPKTATHAIRFALRPFLEEGDEEQVNLFVRKKYSDPRISQIPHGHITCQQLKAVLDDEIWNSYHKFSFVRNPYDRFLSFCAFMFRNNQEFEKNPQKFMFACFESKKVQNHFLFQEQSSYICNDQHQPMVDYIGRFESLQSDFDSICNRLQLKVPELDKINSSKHGSYEQYFDNELKEKVFDLYRRDFENFDYPK